MTPELFTEYCLEKHVTGFLAILAYYGLLAAAAFEVLCHASMPYRQE
jgi:hypothetical protein